MVFGGVVVGFARILVAEGVPLIVAGMVELRSKILPRTSQEVCSSFTQRNSAVAPVVASVVLQVTFTQHTNTHRPNSKA
jgi:ABC-type sulfate transport system permease component